MDCKSIGLTKRMKFLFKYNIIIIHITWITVMFQILLYHLIRYVTRTPYLLPPSISEHLPHHIFAVSNLDIAFVYPPAIHDTYTW